METPNQPEQLPSKRRRIARFAAELLGTLNERQKSARGFAASFGKEFTSHADIMFRTQMKDLTRKAVDMELRHPLTIHLRRKEDIARLPDITRALCGQSYSIADLTLQANTYANRPGHSFSDVRQAAQAATVSHRPYLYVSESSSRGVDEYIMPTRISGVTMGVSSPSMQLIDSPGAGPVNLTIRYFQPGPLETE